MAEKTEVKLEDLSKKDYSKHPRLHTKIEGQTAGLRRFDPADKEDMQRLRTMLHDKDSMEWFVGGPHSPVEEQEGPATDADVIDWAVHIPEKRRGGSLLFAVVGSDKVQTDEKGEVQGWIAVWKDEQERVNEMRKRQMIPAVEKQQPVYELSYAKLKNAAGGQIASAVRQTCVEFARIDGLHYAKKEEEERKAFEAKLAEKKQQGMTLEEELADRSEFDENMVYKYNKPRSLVTAYVSPENKGSVHVLEASGFVNRGLIDYKGFTPEHTPHYVYVLDWDLLNKKLHEAADTKIQTLMKNDEETS